MKISNLTEKHFKNVKQFAISDLVLQGNSTINFDDFNILAADCAKFKLLLRDGEVISVRTFVGEGRWARYFLNAAHLGIHAQCIFQWRVAHVEGNYFY